jgi:hypothetical protein
MPIIVILTNLIIKGFKINQFPNSLSSEEITLIKLFPPLYTFPRLIPVIASTLISLLIYFFFFKETKNKFMALAIALSLAISPWIFILSRYLNYYLLILLAVVLIGFYLPRYVKYIFSLVFIIGFVSFINQLSIDHLFLNAVNNFPGLLKLFSFQTLFFQGDSSSTYIKIPETGFFMYLEFIPLIFGIYLLAKLPRSLKNTCLYFFIIGLVWFLILPPTALLTYRSLIFLFLLNIIIGIGYYQIFFGLFRKNKLVVSFLGLILVVANIFYYQELCYNHFDKFNSSQWNYAEKSFTEYLSANSVWIKTVYITNESGKIFDYISLTPKRHLIIKKVSPGDLIKSKFQECRPVGSLCLVQEREFSLLGLTPENILMKINYANGLAAYDLLKFNPVLEILK